MSAECGTVQWLGPKPWQLCLGAGFHYCKTLLSRVQMMLKLETDPSEILNELIYSCRKVPALLCPAVFVRSCFPMACFITAIHGFCVFVANRNIGPRIFLAGYCEPCVHRLAASLLWACTRDSPTGLTSVRNFRGVLAHKSFGDMYAAHRGGVISVHLLKPICSCLAWR